MNIGKTGGMGEEAAREHLESNGYKILRTNYQTRYGEIDIICEKDGYLAFCEVKTRAGTAYGFPRDFVTAAKQKKIISTAQMYLSETNAGLQPRFDVIEVFTDPTGSAVLAVSHLEDAFGENY